MNSELKLNINFDTVFVPKGYSRKEFVGRTGLAKSGKISAFYYDPNGRCIKNKNEFQKSLGNKHDLSILDFRTGKISPFLVEKSLRKPRTIKMQQVRQPHRQKHVLIKQNVTCLKTQPTSKVNHEIKQSESDRMPRQLFWAKRLACYGQEEPTDAESDGISSLPKNIKLYGPETDSSTAIRSIAAAFQSGRGIYGQNDAKMLDKNPCIFINPNQPLVQSLVIGEEDIRKQEERVLKARKQLEAAYKNNELVA